MKPIIITVLFATAIIIMLPMVHAASVYLDDQPIININTYNITNNITTAYNDTNITIAINQINHTINTSTWVNGTGTIGYIPIWTATGTINNSPIFRAITDEDYMTFYNGDLYIDDTNGMVGINLVDGEPGYSYAQAFTVTSEIQPGIGTINSTGEYNATIDATLAVFSNPLPESFVDASNVYINGTAFYIFSVKNSTAAYFRGNWSSAYSSNNWTWQQAPYIDVNGAETTERGYTWSQDGVWKWAAYVADNINSTRWCLQNSDNYFRDTSDMFCSDITTNTFQTVGGITSGDPIYVGYGASANNTFTSGNVLGSDLPTKYVGIDTTDNDGGAFILGHQGDPLWDVGSVYQGEQGKFLYVGYNYLSGDTAFTISERGRVGVNKQDNLVEDHMGFNGTGKNDASLSGTYSGAYNDKFEFVAVNGTAFKWRVKVGSNDWSAYSNNITMNGTPQYIYKGVSIQFNSTTGHTANDVWYSTVFSQTPQGTFTINPVGYLEVLVYNGSDYIDNSFESQTSGGTPFNSFNKTNNYLYAGKSVQFGSTYVTMSQFGAGMNMTVEYWNGTTWRMMNASELLTDGTKNFTQNGAVSWDVSVMGDWTKNVSVSSYASDSYYWLRFGTTSNATITPKFYTFSPQAINRFEVYQTALDTEPIFSISPNGNTVIGGTLLANGFYGEMYNASTYSLTLTTSNVWYNMTNYVIGEMSGVNSTGNIMTVLQSGLYRVDYMTSATVNANEVVNYQVLINNTLEPKGDMTVRYTNGEYQVASNSFFRRFNGGENVYLQVRDTGANGKIYTADNRNILLTRIGN